MTSWLRRKRRRTIPVAGAAAASGGTGTIVTPPTPPIPPTITTTSIPDATDGTAYSFTLGYTGGTAPVTWTATGLPAGLTCSTAGVISGTPTSGVISTSVTVEVTDATPDTTEATYTMRVVQGTGSGTGVTLIDNYYELAPLNSRGVEQPPLWDTSGSEFNGVNGNGAAITAYYVDAVNGNDATGTGTSGAPKKTIAAAIAAVNALAAGNTRTLVLKAGTYRESVGSIGSTSKVVGIQAAQSAEVWWSGCDILTGFTFVAGVGYLYNSTYAPAIVTAAGTPATDQVFVNGIPYVQKTSISGLAAGEFYVDTALQRLWLGDDPTGKTVEATMRGYVFGNNAGGGNISKSNFQLRGIGFIGWGSDFSNSAYAAVWVGNNGTGQLIEKCVFAYSSCRALSTQKMNSGTVRDIVIVNSGCTGWHMNSTTTFTAQRFRIRATNWEQGYDIAPSPTAQIGGFKWTTSTNITATDWMVHDCHSNGAWIDVDVTTATFGRFRVQDNFCFGFTAEVGTGLILADGLCLNNGNATLFNRDGFRVSGYENCELANITSIGNVGAQFGIYEDSRTRDTNLTQPSYIGDTYNCKAYNLVLCNTAAATRSLLHSINGKVVTSGGFNQQTATFTTTQMFATDPYAATKACNDHHNVWIRLNTGRNQFTWATPTSDFTGTGYGATTTYTLAQVQALASTSPAPEANSIAINNNGAAITTYFPDAGTDAYSWSALSTIPTDGRSSSGAVPSDAVCDILGIAHGATAKYGVYNAPTPVQL